MADIINAILSPNFLVIRIGIISYILAAAILVIFSDIVMRHFVFPVSDWIRDKTSLKLRDFKNTEKMRIFAKYFSESIAAAIFLFYCWMGSNLLSEYIIAPIFSRMRSILLILVIISFFLISFSINNERMRKALFDCWKHR